MLKKLKPKSTEKPKSTARFPAKKRWHSLPPSGWLGTPLPLPASCRRTDVRTYGRSRDYYVTTKISGLDRLPNFLSNGAPLAGFARRLRYNGFCIEFKNPSNNYKVSPEQTKMLELLKLQNYKILLSNDYDSIIQELATYFKDVRMKCPYCPNK